MPNKKSPSASPSASPTRGSKGGAQSIKQQLGKAEKVERPEPLPLRRPLTPPLAFPIEALGSLGEAAAAVVEMTPSPTAMACQAVLAAATLAAQGVADIIHPRTGQKRPLSNFFVTVAESGERKSSVDGFAVKPIRDRENELRDRHEPLARKYRDQRAIYDREREGIIKSKADPMEKARQLSALGPPPNPPFDPIMLADDPTVEGLHKLLATSEPTMGVFNDEGVQFIGGYSMKEENQGYAGGTLSLLWDGKPVKRFRAMDGASLVLVARRVSMHLMVQPGIADRLLANAELRTQGLTSRMLVSVPASRIGYRPQKDPKPGTERALKRYNDRIMKLLHQPRKLGGPTLSELILREMKLSPDAVKRWRALADECELAMRPEGRFENIRSFGNKLPEHVLRISAVLELYDNPEASTVSVGTFDRAVAIGRYYAEEALRLFDEGSVSLEIRRAERLLAWLHEKGISVVHLATTYQRGPFRERRVAAEAMAVLEQHGWVVRLDPNTVVDGSRRKDAWEVVQV